MPSRVFLLSPASCSGRRAALLCASTHVPLAEQLRAPGGAPLGDVFSFISQLYFRGKLTYARAFAKPPAAVERRGSSVEGENTVAWKPPAAVECGGAGVEGERTVAGRGDGVLVITTSRGLMVPDARVTLDTLREFAAVDLRVANDAYARPLEAGARSIARQLDEEDAVVLLGSIASDKYVEVLLKAFGERLVFPRDFVGRGDMSRGGLMLRCVREGRELEYQPLAGATRHGRRPPRLV